MSAAADGVAGLPVSAKNEYWDWLPSMNANWEVADNLLVRFAASKVMSRPQLASLTPGTTAFTTSLNANGTAPTLTVGNPYLNPFRATNLDLSFEKYFSHNGLIAVNLFKKNIDTFPQQIALEAPLSSVFEPEALPTGARVHHERRRSSSYTTCGGTWAIRQFKDAPGGDIKGIEVNLQTDFFFLPAPFDKFGITANYTHIDSNLSYLTGTVLNTTQTGGSTAQNSYAEGPFLNTSPDAFNATLYYENSSLVGARLGRVSHPLCQPLPARERHLLGRHHHRGGAACNSPVFADFRL
jgi:iron complex outermembrane receptor protein